MRKQGQKGFGLWVVGMGLAIILMLYMFFGCASLIVYDSEKTIDVKKNKVKIDSIK